MLNLYKDKENGVIHTSMPHLSADFLLKKRRIEMVQVKFGKICSQNFGYYGHKTTGCKN